MGCNAMGCHLTMECETVSASFLGGLKKKRFERARPVREQNRSLMNKSRLKHAVSYWLPTPPQAAPVATAGSAAKAASRSHRLPVKSLLKSPQPPINKGGERRSRPLSCFPNMLARKWNAVTAKPLSPNSAGHLYASSEALLKARSAAPPT